MGGMLHPRLDVACALGASAALTWLPLDNGVRIKHAPKCLL